MSTRISARIVVVEHEAGCRLDRFGPWLREAGVALDVRRPYLGDAVPDPVGADGLLVLGGQMGAYDDAVAPWLPTVRAALREAVATGVPVLGICLGAQLLAAACGGRVERGAAGVEGGVADVAWRPEAAADPLVAGLPDPFPGPTMHDDSIVVLPPGAVWLGSTGMYPHQVFRVGERAWGVQFHPEVALDAIVGWARSHPTVDRAAAIAQLEARDGEVIAAGRLLAGRFASVVRRVATSAA